MAYYEGEINGLTANNGCNSAFGGDWIWAFLLFALLGFGNNNYGRMGGGENSGGVMDAYVLNSDFATLQRQMDNGFDRIGSAITNVNNGLCDGFYAVNTAFGNLNTTLCQEFGGVTNAIIQNGYETRLATQNLSSQLANCCCDLKQGQAETRYADLLNTKTLQEQIAKCCCDNEKSLMQLNYNLAQQNCGTLQAIDKLGDRIIDYMNANEKQNLRDENFALKLSASQAAQNNYLINQLGPKAPIPAYPVFPTTSFAHPTGVSFGTGNCGCANVQ